MQNIAEFRIIGRIAKITRKAKVTYIDIAANYGRKTDAGWEDDPHWNTITLFGKLHERADKHSQGDLIHVTGRVRQNRFEKDGETRYGVDLIANAIGVLIRKGGNATQQQADDHADDLVDDNIPF